MPGQCAEHPSSPAVYQCDGCSNLLCPECVEEGHRLLFCRHCGERALPLAAGAAQTTPELRRERKLGAPYSFGDALFYPFRGLGAYLYFGYVTLLVLFQWLGWLPGFGCAVLLFQLLIALILPGLLFKIVRTSANGETELPDWPDWSETGERLGEVVAASVVVVVALLPLGMLLEVGGCGFVELVQAQWGLGCLAALAIGLAMAVTLWVPAFGAVGTYSSGWLAPRIDLHVRALVATSPECWRIIVLVTGFYLASQVLKVFFRFIPFLGSIFEALIGVYATFVAMHLVGLLFRRNAKALESVYL